MAIGSYGDEMARSKAFNLSFLATNHLLDGDIEYGVRIGHQVVGLAQKLQSIQVRRDLKPLYAEAEKRKHNPEAYESSQMISRFMSKESDRECCSR